MKNLRKNTGGYALLYVMVVIILLCAVAMMVCTVAMQNLQAQQKSVEQMEAKYEAQGEVEKILAQLAPVIVTKSQTAQTDIIANAKALYIDAVKAIDVSRIECTISDDIATITVEYMGIQAVLKATLACSEPTAIYEKNASGENTDVVASYECTVSSEKPKIEAYTIESGGGA